MRVRHVIDSHYPTLGPNDLATHARALMRDLGLTIIPVIEAGTIKGVIKRVHVLSLTSTKSNALVRDIMEIPKLVFRDDEDVGKVVEVMIELDEWYAPVVHSRNNKYLGVISLSSFLRKLGKLLAGNALGVKVRDIMTERVEYFTPDDTISKVWRKMLETGISGFPVTKSRERPKVIGIITQYDLLRKGYTRIELESEKGPKKGPKVREAMTTPAITLSPESDMGDAIRVMIKKDIGRIPVVVNDNILVGIVDRSDVSKALLEYKLLK